MRNSDRASSSILAPASRDRASAAALLQDALCVQLDRVHRVLEIVDEERDELLLVELETLQVVALALELRVELAALGREPAQAHRGMDPHDQLGRPVRLGDEVIAAGGERVVERIDVALRGDEHDRDVATTGQRADPLARLDPVEDGHADVEQHDVDGLSLERGDRFAAGAGSRYVDALILERGASERHVLAVVVDDENRLCEHVYRHGVHR